MPACVEVQKGPDVAQVGTATTSDASEGGVTENGQENQFKPFASVPTVLRSFPHRRFESHR